MRSGSRALRSVLFFQVVLVVRLFSLSATAQIRPVAQVISSEQKPLEPPGEVAGHVYGADTGESLFDAIVVLFPEGPFVGRLPEARTGADGGFNFTAVAPGNYTVEANADEFLSRAYDGADGSGTRPRVISINPGQRVEGIDIRLNPAGTISGTVYDENGMPAHDVMVLAIQPRFDPGGREDVSGGDGRTVDDDGNFHISRLRPGSYLVRAGGPSGLMAEGFRYRATYYPGTDLVENAQAVQVIARQDTGGIRISVKTENTYKIRGTILDPQANGHRHYEIAVSDPDNARVPICCNPGRASIEKSFTTGGLPSGDYVVSVSAIEQAQTPGGWTIEGRGYAHVSLRDTDSHVNISLGNGGEIRGKISIEGLHGSIPTPRVALVRTDGPRVSDSSGLIDHNGEFDIRDISPGAYRFSVPTSWNAAYLNEARCLGIDHTIDPLEIDLNEVVTDCELIIRADPGAIRGQVLIGDRPGAGMVVVLAPEESELRQLEGYTQTAQSGPGGQFQMSGVIPGKYLVFVTPPLVDESYYAPEFISGNRGNA